ncbi:MAG: eamA-like transporter family protein [Rhizobium sp.]|nr:eamA-like transporter family protein [Rhizobium sp.]
MQTVNHNAKAATIALASYAVFTGSDTIIKLLSDGVPLAQVTFISTGLAAAFIVLQAIVTGKTSRLVPRFPIFTVTRAVILASETALIFYAFSQIPLTEAYVLAFLAPIFVALLAFLFLKERLSWLATIGVILGFVGVVIVLRPTSSPLELGHFAAIGSAFLFAITLLMLKRAHLDESDLALAFSPLVILSVSALMTALWSDSLVSMSWRTVAIFMLGGVCMYAGNMLLVRAFRTGQPSIVAPFQYSQLFWGSLFSYFIFGATIDLYTIIGAAVIVLSGLLVLR